MNQGIPFPVQLLLVHWFRPLLSPSGLTIAAVGVTAILAALSWYFVERPFLRMKRSKPPVAEAERDEWLAVFAGTDACVTPVLTLAQAPDDPSLN